MPDGVDYNLGSANIPPAIVPVATYPPCAGNTSLPPDVYLCPDGTTVLTFGPIANTGAGTDVTISFTGTVRTTYRSDGVPDFADAELHNQASITFDASIPGLAPPNSVAGVGDADEAVRRPGNPAASPRPSLT